MLQITSIHNRCDLKVAVKDRLLCLLSHKCTPKVCDICKPYLVLYYFKCLILNISTMYVCGFCRRQESQQSNASTSSLPSLPDNLPDLSTQGYTIPRLKTPSLKRSINIANLTDLEWEESEERGNMKKRPRHEAHYNSISSSLSSMRRMKIKQVNVMFTLHVFTCILDI